MLVTISQGSVDFELERFAGRRRSSGNYPDNRAELAGGDEAAPLVAPGMPAGAEFIETTMGVSTRAALTAGQVGIGPDSIAVRTDSLVVVPPGGSAGSVSGSSAIANAATAVEGSGGGYLSNEIYYRTLNVVRSNNAAIPMIHLHTPALEYGAEITPSEMNSKRTVIVAGIREILQRALPNI
jgi:hypothetical protein